MNGPVSGYQFCIQDQLLDVVCNLLSNLLSIAFYLQKRLLKKLNSKLQPLLSVLKEHINHIKKLVLNAELITYHRPTHMNPSSREKKDNNVQTNKLLFYKIINFPDLITIYFSNNKLIFIF